jgi:hypothetical protein
MQPAQYLLTAPPVPPSNYVPMSLREQYQYYADGRLQQMLDLDDSTDPRQLQNTQHFSRTFNYDHAGRIIMASGASTSGGVINFPFRQNYTYDEFNNPTSRTGAYYYQPYTTDAATYVNNRRTDWTYDADGRAVHCPVPDANGIVTKVRDWQYDAAGLMNQTIDTKLADSSTTTYTAGYDGDGQAVAESTSQAGNSYNVRSSVMGGKIVTVLTASGDKKQTLVSVDGLLTVLQQPASGGVPAAMQWLHDDPHGLTEVTNTSGQQKAVYDPLGNYIPVQPWPGLGGPPSYLNGVSPNGGQGSNFGFTGTSTNVNCTIDGVPVNCNRVLPSVNTGSLAVQSIVSPIWGSLVFELGLTRDSYYRRVGNEMHRVYSLGFLHNFADEPQNTGAGGGLGAAPTGSVNKVPFPGRDAVKNRINTGDCNAYIASLLAKAAELRGSKALAKDGFDLLSKVKDFVLVDHLNIDGYPVGGKVTYGDTTIFLNASNMHGSNSQTISMFQNKYLDDALHEMGHVAGYDDRELAVAASKLPGAALNLPDAPAPPRIENGKVVYDMNAIFHNGDYYSRELMKHCGGKPK